MRRVLCTAVLTAVVVVQVQPVCAAGYQFASIDYPGANLGTWAYGINNLGQIVGYALGCCTYFSTASVNSTPNLIGLPTPYGFVYQQGAFTNTPIPVPPSSINDFGTIVGTRGAKSSSKGWVDSGGIYTDVAVENAAATILSGIDDSGLMVGSWNEPMTDPPVSHGFFGFSASGPFYNLDYPGALTSALRGVNNLGAVVGVYTREAGGPSYGYFYLGGVFGSTGPGVEINCINDAFAFAGSFSIAGVNHGFVSANGQTIVVDFPGARSTVVSGINNAGTLVGTYTDVGGTPHGFVDVLTP